MTKTTKTSQVTETESLEESAEPQTAAKKQVTPLTVSKPSQPIEPQDQPAPEPSQPEPTKIEEAEPAEAEAAE